MQPLNSSKVFIQQFILNARICHCWSDYGHMLHENLKRNIRLAYSLTSRSVASLIHNQFIYFVLLQNMRLNSLSGICYKKFHIKSQGNFVNFITIIKSDRVYKGVFVKLQLFGELCLFVTFVAIIKSESL